MSCFWGIAYKAFWKQKYFPIFPGSVCRLNTRLPRTDIVRAQSVFRIIFTVEMFSNMVFEHQEENSPWGELKQKNTTTKNSFPNFLIRIKCLKEFIFFYQHSYHLIIRQPFLENVFRRFTPRRTRHNILIDYSKPQSDIFWLILDEKGKPYAKCFCLLMGGKSNYWSGRRGFRNSYVPKLHFLVKRLSHSSDD